MHVELAKVFIPLYEPLGVSKCKKCGKVKAEPKELIRIQDRYYYTHTVIEFFKGNR